MSDADRTQLAIAAESSLGVFNGTSDLTEFRYTGESLGYNIANITSNEINSDRQLTDLIQTGSDNGGGVSFELSYGNFDEILEGLMFSTWSSDLAISDTTVLMGTNYIEASTGALFTNAQVGQWIQVDGFTNASLNTFYQVASKPSAVKLILSPVPATTEAAGNTIEVTGSYIRNGTTRKSFIIQRAHQDLSPAQYFGFTGMVPASMNVNLEANSIFAGDLSFIGKAATAATSSVTSGSVNAAGSTDVMNAVSNMASIRLNDTELNTGALVRSLGFSFNNNLRGKDCIAYLGHSDIRAGRLEISGSMNLYFNDTTYYTMFLNSTAIQVDFRVADAAGNTYIFTWPKVKFQSDQINATGTNTDVMEQMTWQALKHATYNCMMQIDRFTA
jgi:hypothetical protein